jgi:hypothetical protein
MSVPLGEKMAHLASLRESSCLSASPFTVLPGPSPGRAFLETDTARIGVDCGMFQGPKSERELNYRPFPFDPRRCRPSYSRPYRPQRPVAEAREARLCRADLRNGTDAQPGPDECPCCSPQLQFASSPIWRCSSVSKSAAPDKDHQGALMGRRAPLPGLDFRLGSGSDLTKDWPVIGFVHKAVGGAVCEGRSARSHRSTGAMGDISRRSRLWC